MFDVAVEFLPIVLKSPSEKVKTWVCDTALWIVSLFLFRALSERERFTRTILLQVFNADAIEGSIAEKGLEFLKNAANVHEFDLNALILKKSAGLLSKKGELSSFLLKTQTFPSIDIFYARVTPPNL